MHLFLVHLLLQFQLLMDLAFNDLNGKRAPVDLHRRLTLADQDVHVECPRIFWREGQFDQAVISGVQLRMAYEFLTQTKSLQFFRV